MTSHDVGGDADACIVNGAEGVWCHIDGANPFCIFCQVVWMLVGGGGGAVYYGRASENRDRVTMKITVEIQRHLGLKADVSQFSRIGLAVNQESLTIPPKPYGGWLRHSFGADGGQPDNSFLNKLFQHTLSEWRIFIN